jgi:hypothetical protein
VRVFQQQFLGVLVVRGEEEVEGGKPKAEGKNGAGKQLALQTPNPTPQSKPVEELKGKALVQASAS